MSSHYTTQQENQQQKHMQRETYGHFPQVNDAVVFIYVYEDLFVENLNSKQKPNTQLMQTWFNSYAKFHLNHCLQIMGCKTKDAHDITELVFKWLTRAKQLYEQKKTTSFSSQNLNLKKNVTNLQEKDDKNHYNDDNDDDDNDKNDVDVDVDVDDDVDDKNDDEGNEDKYKNDDERDSDYPSNDEEYDGDDKKIVGNYCESNKKLKHKEDCTSGSKYLQYKHLKRKNSNAFTPSTIKKKQSNVNKSKFDFGITSEELKNYHKGNSSSIIDHRVEIRLAKMINENQRLKIPQNKEVIKNSSPFHTKPNSLPSSPHGNPNETIVSMSRGQFHELIKIALAAYDYRKPSRIQDFKFACELQEYKRPMIILFGGTSGCGKSTLASLTASRLGITKVLSTDSIRHMLRSFTTKDKSPILFASTYHAGECLNKNDPSVNFMSTEEKVLEGYRQQCYPVFELLDRIIGKCEKNNETLLVEGVHLPMDLIIELMKKYKSVIPYLVCISNESKHKERFAIRAKYMTLEPNNNKYIKYFENITLIQNYLRKMADKYSIPMIDNTNIDRSLATIHYSVFKCLKKMSRFDNNLIAKGESVENHVGSCLFNKETNKCNIPFLSDLTQISSKTVLKLIRKKSDKVFEEENNDPGSLCTIDNTNDHTIVHHNLSCKLLHDNTKDKHTLNVNSPKTGEKKYISNQMASKSTSTKFQMQQSTLQSGCESYLTTESLQSPESPAPNFHHNSSGKPSTRSKTQVAVDNAITDTDSDEELIQGYNSSCRAGNIEGEGLDNDPVKLETLNFGEYSDASLTEGSVFGS